MRITSSVTRSGQKWMTKSNDLSTKLGNSSDPNAVLRLKVARGIALRRHAGMKGGREGGREGVTEDAPGMKIGVEGKRGADF